MEGEEDGAHEKRRRNGVVPAQVLAEVEGDEDAEDNERDDFLDDLELDGAELIGSDAIGRNPKAVLKEGDHPADDDDLPQRLVAEPKVPVPGKRHKDVGDCEKNDCPHSSILTRACAGELQKWHRIEMCSAEFGS